MPDADWIKLCDEWFPEGRNPWRDLYTEAVMDKIANTLRIEGIQAGKLHTRLCRLAESYLTLMGETALHADRRPAGSLYRDNAKWLREKVAGPATALLTALDHDNRGRLSPFPNLGHDGLPPFPAFPYIEAELAALRDWATALAEQFDTRPPQSAARPIVDIKYALTFDLLEIYVRVPKQGGDREDRTPTLISTSVKGKQRKDSEFAEFVRLAAAPILGGHDELTDQIATAIRKHAQREAM